MNLELHPDPAAPKANFFLVGAPKAGTTSIDRLLRAHPQVFLSPIKEPCHFCPDVVSQVETLLARSLQADIDDYLSRTPREPVHLLPVTSKEHYARLFEGAGNRKIVGECSTFYLSSVQAPANIRSYNHDAQIAMVLRRPLDRIRSHYAMDRSLGLVNRPLLELVEEELELGEDAHWGNCRFYVGASRYAAQLDAFRRHFAPGNICVLSFEKLVSEPAAELGKLFAFLRIAPPAPLVLPLENKSRAARFGALHARLRRSQVKPWIAGLLKHRLPRPVSAALERTYYRGRVPEVPARDLEKIELLLQREGIDADVPDAATVSRIVTGASA